MMEAILNLAILDSAILYKTLTQTNSIWLKLIHSDSTWWWQPSWILPAWIQPFCTKKLHSFMLTQLDDGSHLEFCHLGFSHLSFLVFPLKLTHTCQDWFPPFAKKNLTHSFWLNLMMAAIFNSGMLDSDTAILDSDTLLSSQIHSKTLSLHSDSN